MKRCSQCDFIYEDDQHLCDMDGHELVYEPTLQALQIRAAIAVTEPVNQPFKSGARRQALAAAVAVLIATVLSVGYSGFTSDYAPQSTKAPSTKLTPAEQFAPDQTPPSTKLTPAEQFAPDQTSPTPVVSPTPSPSNSPRLEKSRVSPTVASPVTRSSPVLRSPAPREETARSQPGKANHKKESGIGGFLRKTGKVLKRPFKKF